MLRARRTTRVRLCARSRTISRGPMAATRTSPARRHRVAICVSDGYRSHQRGYDVRASALTVCGRIRSCMGSLRFGLTATVTLASGSTNVPTGTVTLTHRRWCDAGTASLSGGRFAKLTVSPRICLSAGRFISSRATYGGSYGTFADVVDYVKHGSNPLDGEPEQWC